MFLDELRKTKRKQRGKGPAVALTKAIRDVLTLHGWYVWKNGASAISIGGRFVRTGTVGLPDLMALKNRTLLAVEVKAGRDTVKPEQAETMMQLKTHGAIVVVARSVDDVLEVLRLNSQERA